MKRTGLLIGALVSLAWLAIAGLPVFGEDASPVAVTIDVVAPEPCITVDRSSVDYGPLQLRKAAGSTGVDIGQSGKITITNCGDRTVDIFAQGAPATATGATWTLSSSPTNCTTDPKLNQYSLKISPFAGGGDSFYLTTAAQELLPDVASTTTGNAYMTLFMPCAGSTGEGQTMSTTVTFIAAYPE